MLDIKETVKSEVETLLRKFTKTTYIDEFDQSSDTSALEQAIREYFSQGRYSTYSVLGIDIYRYSKYPETQQFMIPIVFKLIYDLSIMRCLELERFLFQSESADELGERFISTGDGGFQILHTPLHAFLLACYFETSLRTFNSFSFYPLLRQFTGPISVRYTVTHDKLYRFDNNYFGPAMINNARIIARDVLNRFLHSKSTKQG